MIDWFHLALAVVFFLLAAGIGSVLFIYARPRWRYFREGPKINPNAKCPACGNFNGTLVLQSVHTQDVKAPVPMVLHTCAICKAPWYEPCVVAPEKWFSPLP